MSEVKNIMNVSSTRRRRDGHGPRAMRGVTLIELMIVTVVVAILTTIAVPSYRQHMLRTHRAGAKATLMQAAQELERCYTRFNAYNAGACTVATTLGGAGVNSEGNYYTVTFTAAPSASAYSLTAAPQGSQTQDTACGSLTLTQAGTQGQSGTATNCW